MHPNPKFRLLVTLLLLGLLGNALAAPKAKLWSRWQQHDPASTQKIDHEIWNEWLGRFVSTGADGINRVAYASVDEAQRKRLQNYLDYLTSLPIAEYNRAEQRAYWINLYNALTVDVVLEAYPVSSIRKISSGLFSSGPWRRELAQIDGEALSLDDIEHRILRPIWQDPRVHYAVNCASLGCPNLLPRAFTAANTEQLLDSAAIDFINHARGASLVDGKLRVSSIYDWFEADFGGNEAGVIRHLRQYAQGRLAQDLADVDSIDDYDYEWDINSRAQSE